MFKRIFLLVNIFSFCFLLYSQTEMSVFSATGRGGVATTFVTDYQAIGINPANLGWAYQYEGKKASLGFLEFGASVYSDAISKDSIRKKLFDPEYDMNYREQLDAALAFIDNGLYMNLDIQHVGFAYSAGKIGGFAFNIRERGRFSAFFNKNFSELIFLGRNASYFDVDTLINGDSVSICSNPQNISEIMDGSRISMLWYREYNFSYGKIIFNSGTFALYGGVGFKYLQGFALLDIYAKKNEFIQSYSAITPKFGIDLSQIANNAPSNVANNNGFLPKPMGTGFGFDFGLNLAINHNIKIGVALNNIGSITWNGNVYKVKDTVLTDMKSSGLASYNIAVELEEITTNDEIFKWEGVKETKVTLPTLLRIGGSYKVNSKLEAGIDVLFSTNKVVGSLNQPFIGLGVGFKPLSFLTLSGGFNMGGNSKPNVPFGITFHTINGSWEAGLATRDVLTFISKNKPNVSFSFGFLRFRFGKNTSLKESDSMY